MVEDWETSHLDGKCSSQVGYVYNRPVCLEYGQLVLTACLEAESWYLTKTGWQVRQDKMRNSIRQGRKCD